MSWEQKDSETGICVAGTPGLGLDAGSPTANCGESIDIGVVGEFIPNFRGFYL